MTKNKIPKNLPKTFIFEPPSENFIKSYVPNYNQKIRSV